MKPHYCIINTQNKSITQKLNEYGYQCISTEKSCNVSEPVSLHADVLYLKTGEKELYVSDCQHNNINLLREAGYNITSVSLKPGYKTECKLNTVITDNVIICNPNTCVDLPLIQRYKKVIIVKQGYTKCSTIVLPEDNFITEDKGIYSALTKAGKNCLLVEKGYVKLQGYNYGFIGGASAFFKNISTLLFFGNIKQTPYYNTVKEFCNSINIKIDYLETTDLTDIGGLIEL